MTQSHLEDEQRINQGSYYTPPHIVEIALEMVEPLINDDTIVVDSACGYGDFLKSRGKLIGCDIDSTAIEIARSKVGAKTDLFQFNSLRNVSRMNFNIPESANLVMVGNPPYNDRTSLVRQHLKVSSFNVDDDLRCRDLGISFLRSYNKLQADFVCILHPLSYLIKPANFRALRDFAKHYSLIDGVLISSNEFSECSGITGFPIVIALYERGKGMNYEFIKSHSFRTVGTRKFCLNEFDYVSNYIEKYPSTKRKPIENSLYFWTMRDINALKRNATFVKRYSNNSIVIDPSKLDFYVYVDVFKRHLDKLPFYFGNCDVPINIELFEEYRDFFIYNAVARHSKLKEYFQEIEIPSEPQRGLDSYFKLLLGDHYGTEG